MKKIAARAGLWALTAFLLAARPLPLHAAPLRGTLLENGAYGGELTQRIREAKRRIICAFYLFRVGEGKSLPGGIALELVRARERGVEVTVILEGEGGVGRENRAAARLLSRGGVTVLFPAGPRVTHAKAVAIDDRYLLVGSHNLTRSALSRNNELSVLLDSPEMASRLRRYLEQIR